MNGGRSWLGETFLANPLIERYRFSLLRPATFWIHLLMYAAIAGLILLINLAIYKASGAGDALPYLRALFFQFLFLDILIFWFWASYNAGAALPGEITNRSYDFFKALPLAAHQKAAGIIVGTNLLAYLLGAMTWGPLLIFGRLAQMQPGFQAQCLFLVLSLALLFNTAVLLSSIQPQKKPRPQANPLSLVFVFLFFVLPMAMRGFTALDQQAIASLHARFYAIEAPLLVTIALVALYFSGWTVTGLLRKFTREREPLLSPAGAFLFVFGFQVVAMGFFQPHLATGGTELLVACWLVTSAPLAFVPGGALKDVNAYIERARGIQARSGSHAARWLALARFSNVATGLWLFVTWAVFAHAAGIMAGLPAGRMAAHLLVLMSFYAFYLLLAELYVLFRQALPVVKHLLILIALLEVILPFVLIPLVGRYDLSSFGPLGYAARIFIGPTLGEPGFGVLAFNLGLMIAPVLLIARRYYRILKLRQEM